MGKRTVSIAPIISDRTTVLTTMNSITIFVNVGFGKILLAMPYLASWPILWLVEDRGPSDLFLKLPLLWGLAAP